MNQMADDLLNGSDAEPRYGVPVDTGMATRPSQGMTGEQPATSGDPKAVMIAWVAMLALLVVGHVFTLKIQK